MDVAPGQYWEFTGDDRDRNWNVQKGDLVLVIEVDERVHFADERGDGTVGIDMVYFLNHFQLAPDGAARRRAEMDKLVQELAQPAPEELGAKLAAFDPHLATDGQLLLEAGEGKEKAHPEAPSKALSARGRTNTMVQAKAKVNEFRVALKKYQMGVQERQKALTRLLNEQKALLDSKLAGMKEMIAHAEEAVWTLNLYLGKDEKVIRLKKGEPAPTEQKITIRQLVLYMDEECAVAPETGGIDFKNIEEFDKWLLNPAHLQQVLPETKAVVALKPRRSDKDYKTGNWAYEEMLNANNRVTYWLIRNGDNLYRIYTCLPVDDVIVPRRDEADKLLEKRDYDWDTNDYKTTPLRPGSDGWMKAMEKVDAVKRHYMRVLLFLQGIIDRTHIFHPMPVERVNIMKERVHSEYVDYVYDGQEDRLLPTGRLSFRDWQKSLNAKLEVGHRVIATFGYLHSYKDRISYKNASGPDTLTLYTIDRVADGQFYFYYKRDDTIWARNRYEESHAPKRRASCRIDRSDDNILNYDLADVDSMQFYLNDRVNRHAYLSMFPVLKTAIALKQKEQEEEAPFRLLLIGEMLKSATRSEAEAALPDLVHWWKLKNKIHRALLSDDAKALRMILAEFARRQEQKFSLSDHPLTELQLKHPDALLIAYKGKDTYVVLTPENTENIFVREIHYAYKSGFRAARTLQQVKDKRWTLVGPRLWSWTVLDESDRMKKWPRDLIIDHFLTDPEKEKLVTIIIPRAEAATKRITWRDLSKKGLRPIAVALEGGEARVYMSNMATKEPERILTGPYHDMSGLEVGYFDFTCTRKKRELFVRETYPEWHSLAGVPEWLLGATNTRERVRCHDHFTMTGHPRLTPIWSDPTAAAKLATAVEQDQTLRERRNKLESVVGRISRQAHVAMAKSLLDKARVNYIAEYGNDDLFDVENQHERWDEKVPYTHRLDRAAKHVIERGIDVHGWTVRKLLDEAKKYGFKPEKDDRDKDLIPLDLVIDLTPEPVDDTPGDPEAEETLAAVDAALETEPGAGDNDEEDDDAPDPTADT